MNHTHAPSDKAEVTSDSATSASSSSSTVTHCCQSRYHNVTWAAVLAARSSSSSSSSSSVSSSFVSLPSPALVSPSPLESSLGSIHNNNNNDNNNNDEEEEEEEDDDDDDDEFEGIPPFLRPRRNGKHRDHGTNTGTEGSNPRTALSLGTPRTPQTPSSSSAETLAQRQRRFQQEATVALAQASVNARMQLEEDRRNKRKSAIVEDIEGLKIPRQLLQEMNFAQLQVLVNDLHTQIEGLNEELVHLLIEKDDLHMGQDSMLVDVQDLNSFAQRLSEANNNKTSLGSNNNNSSLKKTTIVSSPSTTSAASRRQLWTRNPSGFRTTPSPSAQQVSVTDTVNGN
ncbi:hypothetical protein ACOMHN_011547 [Nucella lapillus]